MAYRELATVCRSDDTRKQPTRAKTKRRERFGALRILASACLAITALFITGTAQSRRGLSAADILRVAAVSDAQISPDGEWIAYAVSNVDGDATHSTLWLVRAAGEFRAHTPANPSLVDFTQRQPPAQLLPPGWSGSNPRWSPDSRTIAFTGEHGGSSGIWTIGVDHGQPRFLVPVQSTNFFITYAGQSFAWSPDGRMIAFISATEESSDAQPKDDPRVIERLQYKSRTAFSDRRRTHVYYTSVDNPEPHALTSGPYYDHAVSFSPRGDEVAFLSNHEADPDANNNSDIFAVDLHGQVRQITDTKGCEYEPAWSPNGKWIAYTATKRDVTTIDSVAEDTHVWVIDAAGGGGRELTSAQDRRARNPRWSPDGTSVFYLAGDQGSNTIFSTTPAAGRSRQVVGNTLDRDRLFASPGDPSGRSAENKYQISSFSVAQRKNAARVSDDSDPTSGSVFAYILSSPAWPNEVWWQPVWAEGRRLSRHNEALVRNADFSEPGEFIFRSFDGVRVQGWLMKPADWRADRKYPLILSIHGGPHGMFGWALNPTFQVYAARGYAVLYLNPRGSSGYGQKFSDGTLNEWGGGDYKDLMAGLDEALRRNSWIDQDRLGVTGGSYGGFMTNWIITQTPRFRAAVAAASVSNLVSFYATSLYQDLVHAEFGGFPWDNYDLLWRWSPLRYVRQAQTPTLFIHGEQDNDVHITQAEEMYMALKRRGVESVLVRYPREGHGLREPLHRVDALQRTVAWFDRFLK